MPKTILFTVVHPDDEVLVSGALANIINQGHDLYLAYSSTGRDGTNVRDPGMSPDDLETLRMAELQTAMTIMGVTPGNQFYLDVEEDSTNVEVLYDALVSELATRSINPDVIITFDPAGLYGHAGHVAMSNASTQLFHRSTTAKALMYFAVSASDTIDPCPPGDYCDPSFGKSVEDKTINYRYELDAALQTIRIGVLTAHQSQYTDDDIAKITVYSGIKTSNAFIVGGQNKTNSIDTIEDTAEDTQSLIDEVFAGTPVPETVTLQTTTLDIDNSTDQIIENYVFSGITGNGIRVGANVTRLTIRNCVFSTISENGIYLRVSGNSVDTIIEDCTFDDIGENGVLTGEPHTGLIVRRNVMGTVALDPEGTAPSAPHHGCYIQCPGALIEDNLIKNVVNDNGNGITIRSNGTVQNNTIEMATKYGVSYYSDHPGAGGDLLIQGNRTYVDNARGINVLGEGTTSNYVDNIDIKFNYIFNEVRASIGVDEELNSRTTLEGNYTMKQIRDKEPWIASIS